MLSKFSIHVKVTFHIAQVVDMWKQRDMQLEVPEFVDVDKYAKALDPPNEKLICNNIPVSNPTSVIMYQ